MRIDSYFMGLPEFNGGLVDAFFYGSIRIFTGRPAKLRVDQFSVTGRSNTNRPIYHHGYLSEKYI